MKIRINRIVITIIIIVIGMIALLRWITWGFPWETMKVSRFAQEYVDTHYDEPIKVVGSKRFLREKGYDTVVQMLNYPEIHFTISWDLNLKFIRDDSQERIIEYNLSKEICTVVDGISSKYKVQVATTGIGGLGEKTVHVDASMEDISTVLDNHFIVYLSTNESITADNYTSFLPEIYEIVEGISNLEYRATRIIFYTNDNASDKDFEDGKDPSLNLRLSNPQYLSIKSPEDIIPYIENAIEDNPYYGN